MTQTPRFAWQAGQISISGGMGYPCVGPPLRMNMQSINTSVRIVEYTTNISFQLTVYAFQYSVGHYPNTALFNPPKKKIRKKSGAGEWPKLFREINVSNNKLCVIVVVVSPCFWQIFPRAAPPNAPSTAHGARSAASSDGAATESLLRRSRCRDGYAQTSSVALILRVASS